MTLPRWNAIFWINIFQRPSNSRSSVHPLPLFAKSGFIRPGYANQSRSCLLFVTIHWQQDGHGCPSALLALQPDRSAVIDDDLL